MTINSGGTAPLAELAAVTIDCPDPDAMAAFYTGALGGTVTRRAEGGTFIEVRGLLMIFRRVDEFKAPTWPTPDVPMQIHFEFYVENLSEAKAQLRQLGATRPQLQAERDTGLLVMIDPAGHPFSSSPGSSAARPQQNQRSDPSLRLSRGL